MKRIDDVKLHELVKELSKQMMTPRGSYGELFDELDDPIVAELTRHVTKMWKLCMLEVKLRGAIHEMRERRSYPRGDK